MGASVKEKPQRLSNSFWVQREPITSVWFLTYNISPTDKHTNLKTVCHGWPFYISVLKYTQPKHHLSHLRAELSPFILQSSHPCFPCGSLHLARPKLCTHHTLTPQLPGNHSWCPVLPQWTLDCSHLLATGSNVSVDTGTQRGIRSIEWINSNHSENNGTATTVASIYRRLSEAGKIFTLLIQYTSSLEIHSISLGFQGR